jgi:hypothetical protein
MGQASFPDGNVSAKWSFARGKRRSQAPAEGSKLGNEELDPNFFDQTDEG